MEAEKQNQPITAPEMAVIGESVESKSKRGGKRAGAGRKPDLVKRMISRLTPATAQEVLSTVDAEKVIKEIFQKGSLTLKQRTLADLWDRAWGRPAQAVSVSGAVLHAHWTPGKYSHLTDDEFATLAALSAKALGPPAPNTSQNAPQNQTESKPAIEAKIRVHRGKHCEAGNCGKSPFTASRDSGAFRGRRRVTSGNKGLTDTNLASLALPLTGQEWERPSLRKQTELGDVK
jgi:hypothetical protein